MKTQATRLKLPVTGIFLLALFQSLEVTAADAGRPKPFTTLNPPPNITPAMTREWFPWSSPNWKSPNPDELNRYPRQTWTPAQRQQYEARVDWFHEAKCGIFFHFLSRGQWTLEEWDKWVDAVDVEKAADQAKALGVGYVILTLGQNQIYACAPNPIIEKHWGPHTSERDLPMDLYKALEKRGIPMMLYIATDNQHKMPLPKTMRGKERFDRWVEVAEWYSSHYGTKCRGWWVDGLSEFTPGYCAAIHKALNPAQLRWNIPGVVAQPFWRHRERYR